MLQTGRNIILTCIPYTHIHSHLIRIDIVLTHYYYQPKERHKDSQTHITDRVNQ